MLHQDKSPQQRRMTAPSSLVPPPRSAPLDIPQPSSPSRVQFQRPPSPLRNSITESEDGSDGDEDNWRAESPSSSLAQLASSLAQRVGISSGAGRSLPSDAELEAEAARDRERSRREAERILTQEAEDRRKVEERIRGLLDSSRNSSPGARPASLPPPASALNTGAVSSSPKDGGSWWAAAKARLTPTKEKEPLTPAQQIIQDTRAKEKKDRKGKSKPNEDWPASGKAKLSDPSYLNLSTSKAMPDMSSGQSPVRSQPTTPTRNAQALPPPRRTEALFTPHASPIPSTSGVSPAQRETSLYLQHLPNGSLDMETTLIVIAKRFEKLERWTVSHVHALEERMGDVERWLVEKEEERQREGEKSSKWRGDNRSLDQASVISKSDHGSVMEATNQEMAVMRDELDELRSRVGILGREVARLAPTSLRVTQHGIPKPELMEPAKTLVTPLPTPTVPATSVQSVQLEVSHTSSPGATSRDAKQSQRPLPPINDNIVKGDGENSKLEDREAIRPPVTPENQTISPTGSTSAISTSTARTKLPYPSGDYTLMDPASPSSPALSRQNSLLSNHGAISGLPRSISPISSIGGGAPSTELPPIQKPFANTRAESKSPSPTPRKRYTVALGKPISSSLSSRGIDTSGFGAHLDQVFSDDAPDLALAVGELDDDQTIGKTKGMAFSKLPDSPTPPTRVRPRPQSTYAGITPPPAVPITPLRPKARSKSSDRIGLGITTAIDESGKFKDPYLERQKEREKLATPKTPVTGRNKVPIDQLVKFFDGGN